MDNKLGGIAIDQADVFISHNLLHHNAIAGVLFKSSSGSMECNRVWASYVGVTVSSNSYLLLASNSVHDCNFGFRIYGSPGTRLLGNSLYDDATGVALGEMAGSSIVGNAFARSGCGVRLDPRSHPSGTLSLGPGNTFSGCAEVVIFDLPTGGDGSPCRLAPSSGVGFCARCSKEVPFGKFTCGGCVKFGRDFSPSYCGADCQRAHWPAHRAECRRAKERQRAREAAHAAAADALLTPPPKAAYWDVSTSLRHKVVL